MTAAVRVHRHANSASMTKGWRAIAFTPLRIARDCDINARSTHDDIYQLAGNDDRLHHFLASKSGFHFRLSQSLLANGLFRAICRNEDATTQLAVNLYANLEFIGFG